MKHSLSLPVLVWWVTLFPIYTASVVRSTQEKEHSLKSVQERHWDWEWKWGEKYDKNTSCDGVKWMALLYVLLTYSLLTPCSLLLAPCDSALHSRPLPLVIHSHTTTQVHRSDMTLGPFHSTAAAWSRNLRTKSKDGSSNRAHVGAAVHTGPPLRPDDTVDVTCKRVTPWTPRAFCVTQLCREK